MQKLAGATLLVFANKQDLPGALSEAIQEVWVVDSADRLRLEDCRKELSSLLLEERLAGATLLVFANKQDLPGALSRGNTRLWPWMTSKAITGASLVAVQLQEIMLILYLYKQLPHV
ncbi:ADP-ribosylation factor-like protein 2 [Trematomus bernacchii]|uniref:ADP-ribosylation factor-like protein 2 n=1 Tax=Trematomus bernacchii TaxID=40690 RepID=UPI00146F409B|nr:ADP-ribosylation factor-like protein 2 [Trematomus bernacchii]